MTNNDFLNYWDYFLYIDKDLKNTNRYLQHTERNLNAFSSEFARIILVACAEIDTICRLLCKEIQSDCDFPDATTRSGDIAEYGRIILSRFPLLATTEVYFTTLQANKKPWDGWMISPNFKSPKWWKDYQLIKHYRHNNFDKATLENALYAVSSLYIMLMYLNKTAFGFTKDINTDDPDCFYSRAIFDYDESQLGDNYTIKQLPDFSTS